MTDKAPKTEVMARAGKGSASRKKAGNTKPYRWAGAKRYLTTGQGWYWLSTVRPDGAPHVMPVLALWSGSAIYVCSKRTARKSRDLEANGHCVVTAERDDVHLIFEGHATRVEDEATLRRASKAFKKILKWETRITGEELDAESGAPTSGGPPYAVYEITPTVAFGFPTDGDKFAPTRWRFGG